MKKVLYYWRVVVAGCLNFLFGKPTPGRPWTGGYLWPTNKRWRA